MSTFPITTFTVVNTDNQSILHSPALPQLGVPYIDVADSEATKLVVLTHEGAERDAILLDAELRITLPPDEFERLEKTLLGAPSERRGGRFPYSVITKPPVVTFAADNERVVELVLPI